MLAALSLAMTAVSVGAQEPDSSQGPAAPPPHLTLRLPLQLPELQVPLSMRPGGMYGPRTPPSIVADRWRDTTLQALAAARRELAVEHVRSTLIAAAAPTDTSQAPLVIPAPEEFLQPERPRTFEALASYADLGIDVQSHLELKFDRLRNARCTASEINDPTLGCQGGFPTPSFDQQFRIRAGGVVSNRVNVGVDYDTQREFSANNNINVFYRGLEDEILQRVEVGNVTFQTPPSRFIGAAVPGNSFGVQAQAQLGPVQIGTILAQQKGSAIRTREFTVGDQTTEPVALESRDLDFEPGRFFWAVNPRQLPGYPAVDVLNIGRDTLPAPLRVDQLRVYRLKAQSGQSGVNPNLGGIDAVAIRDDSQQRVGPFSWELLVEGQDYYLDPSGTWFALASRLASDDFLAVSYVTTAGDTVGTFPAVNGTVDTLILIHEPRRGPEVPTFYYEMRNWYRIGGQDVDRSTIDLALRVGNSETPLDQQGTYLDRLGLAEPANPAQLDEYNRVFPRERDPGGGAPIRDYYVAFPNLTPFADSTKLQAEERNDSLYLTPTYLIHTQGPAPKFAINVNYQATGGGGRSTLNIGSIQIRAGSEHVYLGDRQLTRDVDYTIDYGIGQITFLQPDRLFATSNRVRVDFEENQLFDEAPKSLMGLATKYDLGFGTLNAVGIYQRERTISTRPQLGFEPEAVFVGGLSGDFTFRGSGLTRLLDALPVVKTSTPSMLSVNGEVALSAPNANRARYAYIEDFDHESAIGISLTERLFQRGSAPSSGIGLPPTYLGATGGFDPIDAVPLVWQNFVSTGSGTLQFRPQDIDTSIVLVGAGETYETVLWMTLKPDTVGGIPDPATGNPRWVRPHTPGPRWASITQPLGGGSGVGADLSRVEYLEFWVLEDAQRTARTDNSYLVFDFGRVFEDAVATAPQSFHVVGQDTVYQGLQFVGVGTLNSEKDPVTNVFNAQVDDVGILGDRPSQILNEDTGETLNDFPLCDNHGLAGLTAFYLGDLQARCTRGNGFLDTEDLDGDNRLDITVGRSEEDFVRYVFPVGDDRYFVRDGTSLTDATGNTLRWRLYRIPFRQDSLKVGLPNLRQVEAVRVSMVAPDNGGPGDEMWIALARMRLVGAPWLKRAATPIPGIAGSQGVTRGEVIASIVTTENSDLGYVSPPSVGNLPENVNVGLGFGQVQVNEKSLRLLASDIRSGERAEAFIRFTTDADRNFLKYRTLEVWARGRGPGWNEDDLEFYIKVGRDENNFYMYRVPVRSDTWEPEVVISLDRWLALRSEVETRWLRGEAPSGSADCGGDTTAYVACDGPYLVHVRDPATSPPNLAQVSEVAVGMLRTNETVAIDQAELWVDDIRLSDVVDNPGVATALDVRLAAADVADLSLTTTRRDDRFRQINTDPTYVTDAATRFTGTVQLGKFLPDALGIDAPFTVQYGRTSSIPYYVERTDILASQLPGLRQPGGSTTTFDMALRRPRKEGDGFLLRTFIDPLTLRARQQRSNNVTSLSGVESQSKTYQLGYANQAQPQTVRIVPRFVIDLVNALPDWIRNSEFGKALRSSRFRWNPYQLRFSSALVDNVTSRFVYRVPVALASDSALRPIPTVIHTWQNSIGLDLRPFSTFTLSANLNSMRDIQGYGDTTTIGRLLQSERRQLLGADVGFERARTLATAMNLAPPVSAWLRPRVSISTNFTFSRDPNRRDPVRVVGDTAGAFHVPETVTNHRRRELGASLDLAQLVRGIAGDSSVLTRAARGILPADFSQVLERQSSFDRAPFTADLGYQLAQGSTDAFLVHDSVRATAASARTTTNMSGGSRLPFGALVRLTYRNVDGSVWQRRGEILSRIDQHTREWPSMAMSWSLSLPRAIRHVLTGINAQGQYRRQQTASVQPPRVNAPANAEAVRTENSTTSISPNVTLTWAGSIVTSGRYTNTSGRAVTSGNVTRTAGKEWGTTTNFAFRPPASWVSLPNRIQTTLGYSSSLLAVCLIRRGESDCRTVSDSRRQQLDVRMDTGLSSSIHAGVTFSYIVTDQRHLSQKLSQTVFSIFGDISLMAGRVR